VILSPIEQQIKAKIEKIGTPLKDWDISINYGIKTGYNEAFIIDGTTRNKLIEKSKPTDLSGIIRPILRGRDIKKYGYEFADLWLIYIPWHFPLHTNSYITGASEEAELEFQQQYPEIYDHLIKYKKELSARNKAETGIRYEWYALQRWGANYMDDFSKQKIVWKRVGSIIRFGIDLKGCVTLDSTCFATGNHLKYIVGILNSKLGNLMLQDSPKTGTGDLLISVQAIEPIKIPYPTFENEEAISNIVDELALNENNEKANKQLNQVIYTLYGLIKEEIEFIESQ
jgi:hypothetical protein